jgi:hypothetical protein
MMGRAAHDNDSAPCQHRLAHAVKGGTLKRLVVVAATVLSIGFAEPALAVPPSIVSIGQQDRHATARVSAPHASSVTIYFASKPDRATDGKFLQENIVHLDFLTDSEIQTGQWTDEDRLKPGRYWVMINADPEFDRCYVSGGTYDPACADGFSELVTLDVPRPATRYRASATAYRYSSSASLRLVATPLGEELPYRVCYQLKSRARRCVRGTLSGYSWESDASDSVTVSTKGLPTVATFTWYVGATKVATKRLRVR